MQGGSTEHLRTEERLSSVGERSEASHTGCLGFSGGVADPLFASVFSHRQFVSEVIKPPSWTLILFQNQICLRVSGMNSYLTTAKPSSPLGISSVLLSG